MRSSRAVPGPKDPRTTQGARPWQPSHDGASGTASSPSCSGCSPSAGSATAAAVAGSAYSNDYEIPGTESGRATAPAGAAASTDLGGDSDTIVWHTDRGTVRADDVERRMTRDARRRSPSCPASPPSPARTRHRRRGRISEDGHTAYATVTFDEQADDIPEDAGPGRRRHREGGRRRRAPGGAGRQRASPSPRRPAAHLSEAIGVAVAAVVLFLAFGSLAASLLPIATALVCVGTAYAGIVLLGHAMTVADFAPMLGMLIGLGVGIDYALFIVTRHRRGLQTRACRSPRPRRTPSPPRAAPSSSPGATVCIALLGMLVLRLSFLNGVAIAASLTVVAHRRRLRHPAARAARAHRDAGAEPPRTRDGSPSTGRSPRLPTGFAARWSAFVERHPKLLGAVAVVVMAGPRAAHPLAPPGHLRPGQRPRRPRPPGRRTTCSPRASAPASTAR